MVGIWRWAVDPLGPRGYLEMPYTSRLRFSRDVVPSRAFHRHTHDFVGIREQYARKHYDSIYPTRGHVMYVEPEKYQYTPVFLLRHLCRAQPILCGFGQRTSGPVSAYYPFHILDIRI